MSHALTFLVLSAAISLSGPETISAFEEAYPGSLPYIQDVEQGPKNSRVFDINGSKVIVGYTTDPLPPEIYEHALETSQSWQGAREAFADQAAHVVIALDEAATNHKDMVAGASAVTMVAGAIAAKLPVSAIIVAESELVIEPAEFKVEANRLVSDGSLPVGLWVSLNPVNVEYDDGSIKRLVITRGLKRFVGREVEILTAISSFDAIAQRASDLSHYLVKKGPIIEDGHTFGSSATERIRVKHLNPGLSGEPALSLMLDPETSVAAKP